MISKSEVVFSNRVEALYEELRDTLFAEKDSPFSKRLIIVPSQAMKMWLQLRLAQDPQCGIAMGVSIDLLDKTINQLIRNVPLLNSNNLVPIYPSNEELAFIFEKEILQIIDTYEHLESGVKNVWKPLIDYLKAAPKYDPQRSRKRLLGLCDSLSTLFMQYGRYGCSMLESWENGVSDGDGWQADLWRRIKTVCPSLLFPYQQFDRLDLNAKIPKTNLYLFGISFIPKRVHDFFQKISQNVFVQYYLLSPCQMFWSDCCSDKERSRLQMYWQKRGVSFAQQQALEDLLRDSNPLLGNFGRMGREMAIQIEESVAISQETYLFPSGITQYSQYADQLTEETLFYPEDSLTLLESIQADMGLLRSVDSSEKIDLPACDRSIQLHVALTKTREVEILYNNILDLLTRHTKESTPLTPSDIIVMVPEYMQYESAIAAVFGASHSVIDFQMMDLGCAAQGLLVQGFMHLINLTEGRWKASDVNELLCNADFCRRQGFTTTEQQQISRWISEGGVRWGQNPIHRSDILERDLGSNNNLDEVSTGTWEYGKRRLLLGLAVDVPSNGEIDIDVAPVQGIDPTQSGLISRWLQLQRSLEEDLKPLSDETQMTLGDWSCYLTCLLESYFSIDKGDSEGQEQWEQLTDILQRLAKAERIVGNNTFPFSSVKQRLDKSLNENVISYREKHLQAVKFCPLLPMRALPSRVVAILGMQEGVFPRQDHQFSLNQLNKHTLADYCPSLTDFDRYLFLEALLSAREVLLLSYVGYCFEMQAEKAPSILIQELFNYIDDGYTVNKKKASEHCRHLHPFDAFDPSYFVFNASLRGYRSYDYKLSLSASSKEKKAPHTFISSFDERNLNFSMDQLQISISELSEFTSNPLKKYLNKKLGIYIRDDEEIDEDDSFALNSLQKHQLQRKALKEDLITTVKQAEKEGFLPAGLFKAIALEDLKGSLDEVQQNLNSAGVDFKDCFTLVFSDHCDKPDLSDPKRLVLPPIILMDSEKRQIKIVGEIKEVCSEGIIVHGDNSYKSIVKAWPSFLALCIAIERDALQINSNFILTKKDKPYRPVVGDPYKVLVDLCHHYLQGIENPSPLIPDWLDGFMTGEVNDLEYAMRKRFEDDFSPSYNSYANWLFQQPVSLPASEILLEKWGPLAQKLYPLIKKAKKGEDAAI